MVVEIKIDYLRCTGCKRCVEACTFGVLEWFEERPIVTNPSSCSACLECPSGCPVEVITENEK